MFREDPHAERGHELQNDRRRDVLRAIEDLQREPAERWTDDKAACDRQQEGRDDLSGRECVCRNSAHRQTVDQERSRVVEKAFAFQDRQDPMRRPQRPEHGRRGDRIWRGDDGAKRDRGCPRHRRNQRVSDECNRSGRQSDGEHDQAGHRRPVVTKIAQGCVVGGVEKHWRDEQRQHELGRERRRRRVGKEREQRPADGEKYRIRRPYAACRSRECHRCHEQDEKLLQFSHNSLRC